MLVVLVPSSLIAITSASQSEGGGFDPWERHQGIRYWIMIDLDCYPLLFHKYPILKITMSIDMKCKIN